MTTFVFALNDSHILVGFEVLVFLALATVVLIYIGGPGFVRLVSIPQRSRRGLDYLACAVEAEEIAADLLGHARRAAGWRCAGSRGRPAGR